MSTRVAVMIAVALTAAVVLAGAALAVALTRDDSASKPRPSCTGYFCEGGSDPYFGS